MPNPSSSELTQPQSSTLGAYTLAEILSQPQCWVESLKRIESGETLRNIGKQFGKNPEWIFIGCGSSYYIALAAAARWSAITGTRARAVPASEILLFPDLAFNGANEFAPVLISRSGQTSEVLRVAQLLNQKRIASLAISCTPNQKLESSATLSIVLPEADEQSTVMTRSFTSMLLSLQYLAATLAGKDSVLESLRTLPRVSARMLDGLSIRVLEFVGHNPFADFVCLGQGPLYGLACESALKVMEMSRTYAQSFHTLEFRHGPKSVVSGETLVAFLISEENHDVEVDVLEEIKSLGGRTLVVANHVTSRARAAGDLIVELDCALPEPAPLAPFVFAGQLAGFYRALNKGLDPDRPTNLSRVVFLGGDGERPEAADET
ncbi:MAG TPA: SIS domain-containing protein [Terriglobales bacterium]|nr:SIS domain-containing protein [Terriglobales bacterium]